MRTAVISYTLGIGLALSGLTASGALAQGMGAQAMGAGMPPAVQDIARQMSTNMQSSMMNSMMGSMQNQMGGAPSSGGGMGMGMGSMGGAPSMPMPGAPSSGGGMANMGASIAAGMANAMMSGVGQQVSSNISMDTLWKPEADQVALSSPPPTLNMGEMISQAITSMPQQQRSQISEDLTRQNLSMMQQGAAAANQIRNQVRDTIMTDRYRSISSMAPNLYRSNIQPQMVQTIIGNIRPWELPNRFKSKMMPQVVGQVSGQIKMPQINFMQEGIGNAEFPNVPGLPGTSSGGGMGPMGGSQYMQRK
jgi:hypothetical protein